MKKLASIFLGILISLSALFGYSQHVLENKYDVKQYILDLQINNNSTSISGNVTINAITTEVLDTFAIELASSTVANQSYMVVDSVFIDGIPNIFHHHDDLVFVPLSPIPSNQFISVQIFYHGDGGNHPNGRGISTWTYLGNSYSSSFSEPFGSKYWHPSKQVLSDKADSVTFNITTDSTNITGSNGLLISRTLLTNGKYKYKWITHYPTAYYLISFVIGLYKEETDYTRLSNDQDSVYMQNLLIENSQMYPVHQNALIKTNQLIRLYSELFGKYPFINEKYGNSIFGDNGGMENQTMNTLCIYCLDTTMNSEYVYSWYNAHEMAHQWFGDYVTCDKWNDLWLNEGIGTYVEYIAIQNIESQDRANIWMNKYHQLIKTSPYGKGSVYIPDSLISENHSFFNLILQYGKGASAMHMLRYEINNDTLFFEAMRNYLNAFAYSTATTEDFKQSVESTTSTNFDDFFNQWIYGEGYPIFHINWSQSNDTLTVMSNQTASTAVTPLFKTHFDLKINFTTGDTSIRLFQGSNNEVYKLCFSDTVTSITFDPKGWLLQSNDVNLGISENSTNASFDLFPNPAKEKITLTLKQGNKIKNAKISVFNNQGQLMIQQQISEEKTEIDISRLAKGNYYIQLTAGDQKEVKKFVKD